MGRRAHHRHFDTGKRITPEGSVTERKVALCGDKSIWTTVVTDKARVTCSKCDGILARQDLEAYHAVSANSKLELLPIPETENHGYRFAYQAVIGGRHVGYVVYDGAYSSGAWYITEIRIDDKKDTFGTGAHLDKEDTTSRYRGHSKGLEYVTKDRALLAIPELVAKKRLQTVAETKADRADWAAKLARGEAIHQARQTEENQKRKEALEAMAEIRDTLALSNFQRSGLEYAILRLTLKKKPEDDPEES